MATIELTTKNFNETMEYNIHSIPTVLVVRQGVILLNQGGMLPEDAFAKLISHVKELDMDAIRKEIAKNKDL